MYSTDNGPKTIRGRMALTHVPRPEGYELRGCLARSGVPPLARQDQGRIGAQRHRLPPGHAADLARSGRRSGRQQEAP